MNLFTRNGYLDRRCTGWSGDKALSDKNNQLTGWQLDQSAPEAYEQYLIPAIFESWTERLLDRANIQEGDHVLDVACGTGIVARQSAPRVGESGLVIGLDINEGMLAMAEQTVAKVHLDIEWRLGDATELPFSDEEFDVVCCQQALQFFDDPIAALEEMRRVLSPGGRAALSVWRPVEQQPGYGILAEALERYVGDDAGTMMRSPFPEWDVDHLHSISEAAGCIDESVTIEIGSMRYPSTREFVRREAASSPLADQIATIDADTRNELLQDVSRGIGIYKDDQGIITPMESYILQWHK